MPRNDPMVRRQLYLTLMEVKLLGRIAKATGISISEHVRRAVDAYVKDYLKQNGGK